MLDDNIDINSFVDAYEKSERNETDFEDTRFGEIYLDDYKEKFYD